MPMVGVELLHRLHEPDVPLLDEVGQAEAVGAVPGGDLDDEAEVGGDERVGGPRVARLPVGARERLLLVDGEEADGDPLR